jgi:hypothetical protein
MNKNWLKYSIAFLVVFLVRLMPFRAPNVEPIMATVMPLGKVYKGLGAFIFGASSIILFDLITSGLGIWTVVTAVAYGLVGYGASFYFKNRSGWKNYAIYAILATLIYDAVTGLTLGPLFFGMPFMVALVGQISFTAIHLLGNVSFAIVLSPVIERWVLKEERSFVLKKVLVS